MVVYSCSPWLRCHRRTVEPGLRLVCFPHAGGTAAAYRSWPDLLPADVEVVAVQYPGRQDRLGDPFPADLHELADAVCDAVEPLLDRPVALFGHSMGASAAHEVATRLALGGAAPAALFVSARLPPRHHRPRAPHLDERALLADVRSLDPTSGPVLDEPDMRAVVLPAIRADYRLVDTYRPRPGPRLDVPVVAYVGDRDPSVTSAQARAWSAVTTAAFDVVVFPGDHFYLRQNAVALVGDIAGRLGVRDAHDLDTCTARVARPLRDN